MKMIILFCFPIILLLIVVLISLIRLAIAQQNFINHFSNDTPAVNSIFPGDDSGDNTLKSRRGRWSKRGRGL
ncbi:MAG TPA: hypothetical protein VK618_06625 [Flavitalea sp.]|nr:hypothetical protein [Flavitalea sp.]